MSMVKQPGTVSPRWWRRITAVAGTSLALVAVVGASAHADPTPQPTVTPSESPSPRPPGAGSASFYDDFEAPNSFYTWTTEGATTLVFADSDAHSPSHDGLLGWGTASYPFFMQRRVDLPGILDSTTRCLASIWIKPYGGPRILLEVIDPHTLTPISQMTRIPEANSGWQLYYFRLWAPQTSYVYLRLSNISEITDIQGEAMIDDLRVTCLWR